MNNIRKRLNALRELRKETEPGAIIIGTDSGYSVFCFGTESKTLEFDTERAAIDALNALGITKIGKIGCI